MKFWSFAGSPQEFAFYQTPVRRSFTCKEGCYPWHGAPFNDPSDGHRKLRLSCLFFKHSLMNFKLFYIYFHPSTLKGDAIVNTINVLKSTWTTIAFHSKITIRITTGAYSGLKQANDCLFRFKESLTLASI